MKIWITVFTKQLYLRICANTVRCLIECVYKVWEDCKSKLRVCQISVHLLSVPDKCASADRRAQAHPAQTNCRCSLLSEELGFYYAREVLCNKCLSFLGIGSLRRNSIASYQTFSLSVLVLGLWHCRSLLWRTFRDRQLVGTVPKTGPTLHICICTSSTLEPTYHLKSLVVLSRCCIKFLMPLEQLVVSLNLVS